MTVESDFQDELRKTLSVYSNSVLAINEAFFKNTAEKLILSIINKYFNGHYDARAVNLLVEEVVGDVMARKYLYAE